MSIRQRALNRLANNRVARRVRKLPLGDTLVSYLDRHAMRARLKGTLESLCSMTYTEWARREYRIELAPPNAVVSDIEINKTCGLNCVMCLASDMKRPKQLMDMELFEDIVRNISANGQKRVSINFFSDPLINKDLAGYLAVLRRHGMRANTLRVTGAFLARNALDALFDYRDTLTDVCFSLDAATKQTYEKIRVGATWETLHENLRKLDERNRREGSPFHLRSSNVTHKLNIGEIARIPYVFDYVIAPKDHLYFFIESNGVNSFFYEQSCFGPDFYSNAPCYQTEWDFLAIQADGSVSPCCSVGSGSLSWTNVQDHDFGDRDVVKKIKAHPANQKMRRALNEGIVEDLPQACKDCYVIDRRLDQVLNLTMALLASRFRPGRGDWAQEMLDRVFSRMRDKRYGEILRIVAAI